MMPYYVPAHTRSGAHNVPIEHLSRIQRDAIRDAFEQFQASVEMEQLTRKEVAQVLRKLADVFDEGEA